MTNSPAVLHEGLTRGLYVSHGTLEIRDFSEAKKFFREVLGIEAYRHSMQSMFIRKNVYMTIACVRTEEAAVDQGIQNRWGIDVASREDVDRSYRRLLEYKDEYGIAEVIPPAQRGDFYSFIMRDANGNWWEIQHSDIDYDALFASGSNADA